MVNPPRSSCKCTSPLSDCMVFALEKGRVMYLQTAAAFGNNHIIVHGHMSQGLGIWFDSLSAIMYTSQDDILKPQLLHVHTTHPT